MSNMEKKDKFVKTAAQTAILMAILTLLSKFLGFAREMVMAGFFGTSYIVDSYVMANAIPGIIFSGIFGSIATAYIPLFSKKFENGGESEGNRFTSQVLKILLTFSILSAIFGILLSDQMVSVFAPGFSGKTAELTSFFLKITFSYVIFSSIAGVLESFLQYKNTFLPQIVVGYSQNVIVVMVIVISAFFNYYFLVFGLLIAYAVRSLLLWIISKKKGFRFIMDGFFDKETMISISVLAVPVFIGSSTDQINQFVNKLLASNLPEGSVSALNYASTINSMILSLTITILTTIIYPKLAHANSLDDRSRFADIIQRGFDLIYILALPLTLGSILYSTEIVRIIYERGAFNSEATLMTSSAFLFYSIGILFVALNKLLSRVYYSMHNMKTPMTFACISVIINVVLNLLMIDELQHKGLALATSIAAISNTILLIAGLYSQKNQLRVIKSRQKLLTVSLCALVSVAGSYLAYHVFPVFGLLSQIIFLCAAVFIAAMIYLALLWLFKIDDLKLIADIFRGMKRKNKEG